MGADPRSAVGRSSVRGGSFYLDDTDGVEGGSGTGGERSPTAGAVPTLHWRRLAGHEADGGRRVARRPDLTRWSLGGRRRTTARSARTALRLDRCGSWEQ